MSDRKTIIINERLEEMFETGYNPFTALEKDFNERVEKILKEFDDCFVSEPKK